MIKINSVGSTGLRPTLKCLTKKNTIKALYDTGSCVTCMSGKTFQSLHPKDQRLITSGRTFKSASGTSMNATGSLKLCMTVNGKALTHQVHVIPKLHEPLILGIDFIRTHGLGYCPKHHEFHWEEICPREHGTVMRIKEKMILHRLAVDSVWSG